MDLGRQFDKQDLIWNVEKILEIIKQTGHDGKIKLPRGIAKRAVEYRRQIIEFFPKGKKYRIMASNLAYHFQVLDFLDWITDTFDVDFSLLDMINKAKTIFLSSIAEGILYAFAYWYKDFLRESKGKDINVPKGSFEKLINFVSRNVKIPSNNGYKEALDCDTVQRLHNLRKTRNNIHLWNPEDSELGAYKNNEVEKHKETVELLINQLKNSYHLLIYNDDMPF